MTRSRRTWGVLLLSVAAVLFAATTVFAKLANQDGVPGLQAAFARFGLGFLLAGVQAWAQRKSLRPTNLNYTLLRAFFNVLASIFFFLGVEFTTITNANMLNQTAPVYIFLMAPFFAGYRGHRPGQYAFLGLTLLGIWLVVSPDFSEIRTGDVYGTLSGVLAGIAITMLHQARKYDPSYRILFFQMGLGTLMCGWLAAPVMVLPTGLTLLWLALTAVAGVGAQYLLTVGYKFIDAERGSLVSATQIVYASAFGALFFAEDITWRIALGGLCILASLVGVSGVRVGRQRQVAP